MADQRVIDGAPDPNVRRGETITVGSEFSLIEVTKIWTRNGERLEIAAPKSGVLIRLDALELEALTRVPSVGYSDIIRSASEGA